VKNVYSFALGLSDVSRQSLHTFGVKCCFDYLVLIKWTITNVGTETKQNTEVSCQFVFTICKIATNLVFVLKDSVLKLFSR